MFPFILKSTDAYVDDYPMILDMAVVNNKTELVAFSGPALGANNIFSMLGYYQKGDGAGGDFMCIDTYPGPENNGTVIYSSTPGFYFKRIISNNEILVPEHFGAIGNGVFDDTISLIDYAKFTENSEAALSPQIKHYRYISANTLVFRTIDFDGHWAKINCDLQATNTVPVIQFLNPYGNESAHYNPGDGDYTIRRLRIDCQNTGTDGVEFVHGTPMLEDVTIDNPYRDMICCNLESHLGHWMENTDFKRVLGNFIGRHWLHIKMSGNGVVFMNETTMKQCESRGIGRVYADSNIIRITFNGTSNSVGYAKVGGFSMKSCAWDGILNRSVANSGLGDFLYAKLENGANTGRLEHFSMEHGAIESTDGATTGKYILNSDPNIDFNFIRTRSLGLSAWASGYAAHIVSDLLAGELDKNTEFCTSIYAPAVSPRKNNVINEANHQAIPYVLRGDGTVYDAANNFTHVNYGADPATIPNQNAFYSNQVLLVDNQIAYANIPIVPLAATGEIQYPLSVFLYHKGFFDNQLADQWGRWFVQLVQDFPVNNTANRAIATLMESGNQNPNRGFNPSTGVVFTMPDAGNVQIQITCGNDIANSFVNILTYVHATRYGSGIFYGSTQKFKDQRL